MKTLAIPLSIIGRIPRAIVLLAAVVVLFGTFVSLILIEPDYYKQQRIDATVIAKAPLGVRQRDGSMKFILAVRLPDGSLQDVQSTFSRYSVASVGSAWPVWKSDADRGLPMPWSTKVLVAAIFISLFGTIAFTCGFLAEVL